MLLGGEVAVQGAERHVGGRSDLAHLHRVESAFGREASRLSQHSVVPRLLRLGERQRTPPTPMVTENENAF